ncbi:sensor domain-containing protein [Asanoa sp. WMMD1127]|uniref:sensor histidine kinase n=1 Tax=Asanoa sp. WMMD1127 TaxID=3016107 RepID=UPI002416EFB5|nr:sensor histidine kinase [Asanoa sp. WMMD1127]MDG4823087.1 sensor domain-containing protein [Asanoa sp. WMMD1127]
MTALRALAAKRYLLTAWPWRALGYLLTTAPVGFVATVVFGTVALPWVVAADRLVRHSVHLSGPQLALLVCSGTFLLATVAPVSAVLLAAIERYRLRLVDDRPLPGLPPPAPGQWFRWLRDRYTDGATWRAVVYGFALGSLVPLVYFAAGIGVLTIVALVSSPFLVSAGDPITMGRAAVDTPTEALPYALLGLVLLPGVPYLLGAVAGAHGALARVLLGGADEQAKHRLAEVVSSRARLVDGFGAERRRIERDLHDGAQQRLVSLTLQLGVAQLDLPPDSPAGRSVAVAHGQAKQLMAELRELIRGIHPQVLTDSGLAAAVGELADQSTIPVTVEMDLPERPPEHVESTAYFVVAEALANVAKHSGASAVTVSAARSGRTLVVEISDNGHGGAAPGDGSGLTGLADRVAAVGGTTRLSSPAGGPTLLRAELPWR